MTATVSQPGVPAASPDHVGQADRTSMLLEQLPRYLTADPVFADLVRGFEQVAIELYDRPASFPTEFDPRTAEATTRRWMAGWLGLAIDGALTESQARGLVTATMHNYWRRGTAAGLEAVLNAVTGGTCTVTDPAQVHKGYLLDDDLRDFTRTLAEPDVETLTIAISDFGGVPKRVLRQLIERELPVGLPYDLIDESSDDDEGAEHV